MASRFKWLVMSVEKDVRIINAETVMCVERSLKKLLETEGKQAILYKD